MCTVLKVKEIWGNYFFVVVAPVYALTGGFWVVQLIEANKQKTKTETTKTVFLFTIFIIWIVLIVNLIL